jgi:uncharacterized membrane protein YeaQ/YmgE (transglycosylase-associated protein family)
LTDHARAEAEGESLEQRAVLAYQMIMHILWTLLIGFFVGLLARFLMPGDDKMGFFMTAFLGIGGSFAATYGGHALGIYRSGQTAGFFGAVVGAVVLLIAAGMLRRMMR